MSETELQDTAKVPEEATEETEGGKKKKKEKVKRPLWREILSWVLTLLCAFAAAIVIRSIIFEPVRVDGESMDDTLANGEIMLVSKYDYNNVWLCLPWQSDNASQQAPRFGWGNPNFLDVVICRYPDPEYRVRGASDGYSFGPYRVPKKGDTLTFSTDSGFVQFLINGEAWERKKTTVIAKDESGKLLKIYNKKVQESLNGRAEQEMIVISWNGKDWTSENWSEILPELTGKTFTMDENYFFLMGDHRLNSNDSRSVGAVERSMIIGHVRRVAFPFSKWRGIK